MRTRHVSILICVALLGTVVQTQQRGGTDQTDKVPPVNSGANPYRVIRDWAQLTSEGRPWGGSNGVAIDRDGMSVWATDRCSPGTCHPRIVEPATRFPAGTRLHGPLGRVSFLKMEALLARAGTPLEEVVPLLAALLSIPTGDRYAPLTLSPQRQKDQTMEVLIDQVRGLAQQVAANEADVGLAHRHERLTGAEVRRDDLVDARVGNAPAQDRYVQHVWLVGHPSRRAPL